MSAHTGRLLLSPQDPFLLPERAPLTATLSEAGLLGTPLEGRNQAFAVGERFLQLVIFAGCSVRIELSPIGEAPFCHIRFTGPFRQPVFLSGRNTRPPRCRSCRGRLRSWREALSGRDNAGVQITCPACSEASPPWGYDWKGQAGFGRLFIRVEEVFPGEATPTPALMGLLEGSSGCKWQHFYIQDD
ncbi:hypothetical protein [Candidatus Thiosymbion oneisti]|uniref:hypothetical protein n=1 Tax=Candidatus Thiosymbion oneisti TaxID=589554 RepID=UPI000B7D8BB1|nr:hypothetical protein [Candidatus Thiosymbion oneisti]